jgi:hypothetical protein
LNFGNVIPDGATQEVRVYQTESGDVLLKVPTAPVTRYAENFDLTEDGMVAAVVNAGVIQVYKLPAPSAQDVKDLTEAKSFSPPASKSPVRFARLESRGNDEGESESSSAAPDVAAAMTPDVVGNGSGPSVGADAGSASVPPSAAAAPGAPSAAASGDAASAGVAAGGPTVAPAGAEVTKPATDLSEGISDEEAARALGASLGPSRVAAAQPAAKDGTREAATSASGSVGDPDATGRRKPPTLLEPGENVEKVKSPTQQQSSNTQDKR